MKLANSNEYDPKALRIDRQAACPQCSARAVVFEDGAVVCVAEGGLSFVPEPKDVELYQLQQNYRARQEANS